MLSTAVLMAASMVVGQAQAPAPNHQHLKSFDALIGCWCLDGVTLEDFPDGPPKGTKMKAHSSYKWLLNGNAVEIRGGVKIAGLPDSEFAQFVCWNRATHCIVRIGASTNGEMDEGVAEVSDDGKKWTWKIKHVNGEGETDDKTVVLTLKNKDTLVWQELDRTGVLTGDSPKYELKRCQENHQHEDQ